MAKNSQFFYNIYCKNRKGFGNDYLIGIITPFPTTHYEFLIMNSKLSSPLLFPHRDRAVERTVEVGVLASTGSHLNKGLVKGAARQADRSAYGKEAGVYFGRIFVPVGVKRHQVAEIADVGG